MDMSSRGRSYFQKHPERVRIGHACSRSKLTEDQIREAKKRAWETRRAKYGRYGLKKAAEHRRVKLTAEQRSEVAKQNWANRRAKYGEFGAKQKKTPEELAEIGKKIWATRHLNKAK